MYRSHFDGYQGNYSPSHPYFPPFSRNNKSPDPPNQHQLQSFYSICNGSVAGALTEIPAMAFSASATVSLENTGGGSGLWPYSELSRVEKKAYTYRECNNPLRI
ncbi:hypothetical protein NE237_023751 [Protea cynaroides]|uniref:Uncharacterized protein n=1 Tax=Protea cynaroides TaxID=273540 RepID=A0A9Q0K5P6_9MAGN|nr:hypothetical protein NE237_023751 [Protea cynaroides]